MNHLKKTIIFRVDSGVRIGSGHMFRCITLAKALKNHNIIFLCKEISLEFRKLCKNNNFQIYYIRKNRSLEKKIDSNLDSKKTIEIIIRKKINPDLIIIDNYYINNNWEKALKKYVKKIVVIDDFINRKHDCDMIINQNLSKKQIKKYQLSFPENCFKLFGPKFAILRNEFIENRKRVKTRESIKNILISFGSSDPTNETIKAIRAMKDFQKYKIDVVVGTLNRRKNVIKKICSNFNNLKFHLQTDKMALLMRKADISIGAAGTTSWERCCLGLPTIVSILSKDQLIIVENLVTQKTIINLGFSKDVKEQDYLNTFKSLNNTNLKKMSEKCMKIVDANGSIRVAQQIQKLLG